MKARIRQLWKVAYLVPVMGAYAVNGCASKGVQLAADVLDDMATEMNGGDQTLGDWLADEIKGEDDNQGFGEWLADEVEDW